MGSLVVGQRWQVFKNGVSVGLYDLANNPVFATQTSGRHGITSYYAKYPTVIFDDVAIKTPVKTYTGAAWQNHMAKVWDGTKWVTRAARRYDGTNWK